MNRKKPRAPQVDIALLAEADSYVRRAQSKFKYRMVRGGRIKILGAVYNLLAIRAFDNYEDFIKWARGMKVVKGSK